MVCGIYAGSTKKIDNYNIATIEVKGKIEFFMQNLSLPPGQYQLDIHISGEGIGRLDSYRPMQQPVINVKCKNIFAGLFWSKYYWNHKKE